MDLKFISLEQGKHLLKWCGIPQKDVSVGDTMSREVLME
jgi:hypothetical protein